MKPSDGNSNNQLALFGGAPIRTKPFPKYPVMGQEEINSVAEVVKSGNLSMFDVDFLGGEKVKKFEHDFADYHNIRYAISVNSGTAALHVALAAAGVGPGDEVIVPPYTFSASATSILMNNAIPIFVDVEPRTFNLDPDKIECAITSRTKAMIVVHLLGHPADMDRIMKIAQKHRLFVIEDCAQSPGAEYKKRKVGTFGNLSTFSFQKTKNMTTGEGGMILTDDEDLAHRCRLIRNHGEVFVAGKPRDYIQNILGWNYRMTEMEAAIGIEQLKKLDSLNDIRIQNATYLSEKLSELPGIDTPYVAPYAKHVFSIYAVKNDKQVTKISREIFVKALTAEGISVWPGHPRPLYENPIYTEKIVYGKNGCPYTCAFYPNNSLDYRSYACPVTEQLCQTVIAFNQIRPPAILNDMDDIASAFEKIISHSEQFINIK